MTKVLMLATFGLEIVECGGALAAHVQAGDEVEAAVLLSGMGADVATSTDQLVTGALRDIGLFDESRPAYTQTLGWRLGELLGI